MAGRVNYLNNKDILLEIHRSKFTYCAYRDRVADSEYDIILLSMDELTEEAIAQAKQNRVDALKRQKIIVEPSSISTQDLVFRVTTWEHIPIAPPKASKTKKQNLATLFEIDEDAPEEDEVEVVANTVHIRLNFPPFFHYRLDENNQPYVVGKSHWKGTLDDGEFCKDHGSMTSTLARMLIKLCDRYASRSNWRNYCVDVDTEALTKRGWVTGHELTEDDTILSYNDGKMTWSSIKSIFRGQHDGLMHKLDVKGMDALVTPEHKFVTDRGLVKVEDLLVKDKLILIGDANTEVEHPTFSNELVELMGWIFTEGNYQFPKQSISVSQNAGPKADRIRKCLHALGYHFSEALVNNKLITFTILRKSATALFEQFPEKNLSMEFINALTASQRELLIETMIDGDGWRRGTSASYCQKDKTHIDLFQALCAISGRKSNLHYVANHISYGKPTSYYSLNLFNRKSTRVECVDFHGGRDRGAHCIGKGKANHQNRPTTYYKGLVWCPETEYGSFVARRNGKVYLTGNTYNEEMRGEALVQLSQVALKFDEAKSQNPFSYLTQITQNSFTRVLNTEKKMQNIRDDILEINGLNPSWSRQNSGTVTKYEE